MKGLEVDPRVAASEAPGSPVPSGLSAVAVAMWNRNIIMLKRYAFNTLTQLINVYVLFLVVFFGARGIAGFVGGSPVALGDTLDATIVGFFLWFLALSSHSELAYSIMNEARLGTLEQLMMTPVGFRWAAFFETASTTVTNLIMSGVILAAMLLTTGRQLTIDLVTIVPLLLLATATAYGIGFAVAGLALVYKRIDALLLFFQWIWLALIGAPALLPGPVVALLPLSLVSRLLNEAMTQGTFLTDLGTGRLLSAVLNAAACVVLGVVVFSRMERKARKSGSLAQY